MKAAIWPTGDIIGAKIAMRTNPTVIPSPIHAKMPARVLRSAISGCRSRPSTERGSKRYDGVDFRREVFSVSI